LTLFLTWFWNFGKRPRQIQSIFENLDKEELTMPPKKSKKKKTKRVKKVADIPTAPESDLPDLAQFENLRIPKDEDERFELAEELKTGGNRCYAAGEYEKAIDLYSKSINLHQAYKTFGNRSAAYLKVGKYNDAVADASFCTKQRPQVGFSFFFLNSKN
jgi:tetratricopeptide (TPR) repeat protein